MSKSKLLHSSAPAVILSLLFAVVDGVVAQVKTAPVAKVFKTEQLLKETSANYAPFQGPGTFIVVYKGKERPQIDVILVEVGDSVVILADVAAGKEIDLTPSIMKKLLEYNAQIDYIKVGISDIGSIRVQTEQVLTSLTGTAFEDILDQVAAGTDEVTKLLIPVRKKPTTVK